MKNPKINQSWIMVISASAFYDKRLKPADRELFTLISSLQRKEGYCWASNDYLMQLLDISESTVLRSLNNLRKNGYVETKYTRQIGGGTTRKIRALLDTICPPEFMRGNQDSGILATAFTGDDSGPFIGDGSEGKISSDPSPVTVPDPSLVKGNKYSKNDKYSIEEDISNDMSIVELGTRPDSSKVEDGEDHGQKHVGEERDLDHAEVREEHGVDVQTSNTDKKARAASFATDALNIFNEVLDKRARPVNSNLKLIKARYMECPADDPITLDQVRLMLEHMKGKWGNDPDMAQYLRISTLFTGKFFGYLDEAESAQESITEQESKYNDVPVISDDQSLVDKLREFTKITGIPYDVYDSNLSLEQNVRKHTA